MSIDSLCRVLATWETWAQKARPLFQNATYPLPTTTPKFLGYTINDFNLSHGRPQFTFKSFMVQISEKVVNLLYPKLQGLQMTLTEEKYLTAYTKMRDSAQNHHIALSNKQSIPIFEVVLDPQMVQEGQSRTLAWVKFLYEALAVRVLELTSDE